METFSVGFLITFKIALFVLRFNFLQLPFTPREHAILFLSLFLRCTHVVPTRSFQLVSVCLHFSFCFFFWKLNLLTSYSVVKFRYLPGGSCGCYHLKLFLACTFKFVPKSLWPFVSKDVYKYLKLSLMGFTWFFFDAFCAKQRKIFLFFDLKVSYPTPSLLLRPP